MGAHRTDGRRDWLQQDVSDQQVQSMNPWNIMIKHRQVHRRGRRSQMTVSYTDPVISMDLLRTVLQPSFNEDIMAVFRKYMKFFEKAASNVKENVGEDVHTDQLIKEACRNCLDHAKQLFPDTEKITQRPVFDHLVKRSRQMEDDSNQRGSPIPKKRKGRPPGPVMQYDRPIQYSTPVKPKTSEPIKREGPKWDPSRLNEKSTFVLGSRANKLQQELMTLMMSGDKGISAFPESDNLFKWIGTIDGAQGTVYEGLRYKLSLEFPSGYPYNAPRVKFITSCFHPNVDENGFICLDILKEKWSALYDVRSILLSIQSLLGEPNNDSPMNAAAAELWDNQEEL
ncbi:hypothetical protein P4O66_001174 [Electrophorus voltai]|uniref:Deoxynucleotidyltransferase terminal-interacting protein 1 n=1 Tax=Electrophorus voltai TaxID=2609070 RepID=A0AAD8ZCS7_9TELE|nr:hypothetical protein P4O66_001174 [Electrophorus voltai]